MLAPRMLKIRNRYSGKRLDYSLKNLVLPREKPTDPYIWILRTSIPKTERRERAVGRKEKVRVHIYWMYHFPIYYMRPVNPSSS